MIINCSGKDMLQNNHDEIHSGFQKIYIYCGPVMRDVSCYIYHAMNVKKKQI